MFRCSVCNKYESKDPGDHCGKPMVNVELNYINSILDAKSSTGPKLSATAVQGTPTATDSNGKPKLTKASLPQTKTSGVDAADEAIAKGDWAALKGIYKGTKPAISNEFKEKIREAMLGSQAGWKAISDDSDLGGTILSAANPEILKQYDLGEMLGDKKNDVVGEAMLAIARKTKILPGDAAMSRDIKLDPNLFAHLVTQIEPAVWNDTGAAIGSKKRGLAARVCCGLWNKGNFDQICTAIDAGVDTSMPFNVGDNSLDGDEGVWSGFVQPLEHILGKYLKEVGQKQDIDRKNKLKGTGEQPEKWNPDPNRKFKIAGAEKIFAHLKDKGKGSVVTTWEEVKDSQMIKAFENSPGTIWGFEDVRMPFVQAAHDKKGGDRPLRMIELWEAIEKEALTPDGYAKLLKDPKGASELYVNGAIERIQASKSKYVKPELADEGNFYEEFRKQATSFLIGFAAELPKGAFADAALDASGQKQKAPEGTKRQFLTVSDIAGMDPSKLMGGFACKAGIWWAKEQKEKIYYCLDGINMNDVCDYKRVKNAAIDDFIRDSGSGKQAKPHMEVITLVELREIIKNWSSLKDTVVFIRKGNVIAGEELAKNIKEWTEKMEASNKIAGRRPAPPKKNFKDQLDKINPGLMARLETAKEGDMDARDIVKKSGYLMKISAARSEIALKFLMSRCQILFNYELIPDTLPKKAAVLQGELLNRPIDFNKVKPAVKAVTDEIGKCAAVYQKPLMEALVSKQLKGRGAVK